LDGFLRKHGPITGIVNGVDYSQWSPEHDPHIARNYSPADLSGKRECKQAILSEYGLPHGPSRIARSRPWFRASHRKRASTFSPAPRRGMLQEDMNLVVLGSGDPVYESMFHALARAYPIR
jgi:starch synthase